MTPNCTQPRIGALLHAFELQALNKSDCELFEAHLLVCEACFKEIESFASEALLLRDDPALRRHVMDEGTRGSSESHGLMDILWPKTNLLFRPAVLMALILVLSLPAYRGLSTLLDPPPTIESVQVIRLSGSRASQSSTFRTSVRQDGLISLTFPGAKAHHEYLIAVTMDANRTNPPETTICLTDHLGRAELLMLHGNMRPGIYRLEIFNSATEPPQLDYEFQFKIVD